MQAPGIGRIAAQFQRKYMVNVNDHGAAGAGVDETTEIQAAITACPDRGTVLFPNGFYKISSPLTINKRINFVGEGLGSQIYQSADEHLFEIPQSYLQCYIGHLCLGSAATTSGKSLIEMEGSYWTIDEVFLRGGYNGIHLYGALGSYIRGIKICGYNQWKGSPGYEYPGNACSTNQYWIKGERYNSHSINHTLIEGCTLQGGVNGIYIEDTNAEGGVTVSGSIAENQSNESMYFSGISQHVTLIGCQTEHATKPSNYKFEECVQVNLIGCYAGGPAGIVSIGSKNITLIGCYVTELNLDADTKNVAIINSSYDSCGTNVIDAQAVFQQGWRINSLSNPQSIMDWTGRTVNSNVLTFTTSDLTPTVRYSSIFKTNNDAGAITISDFDEGEEGQEIEVFFGDSNTTIQFSGSNFEGNGGVDKTFSSGETMRCRLLDDGKWWCYGF